MSQIEDILMEAWNLGIKDQVMEIYAQKVQKASCESKFVDREALYEESLKEAKDLNDKNGSGSR